MPSKGFARSLLTLALCFGSACAKNPYQMRREFQEQQVRDLSPAALDHGDRAWHAVKTLRVRLYVDPAVAKKGNVKGDFEDRLARVNQVLEPALQLRLLLENVSDLPEQPAAADTGALLAAIEQLDAAKDVDLVVALVGASPVVTLSFHDLGRARVLGKHIVIRSMDDVAELQALEVLDTLSPDERSRLYQQRKRHKETAVLLHEIGHAFGAVHTTDALELMHASYDNNMQTFAPANAQLMGYAVDERLADESKRDPAALEQRLADFLKHAEYRGWVEDERREYVTALEDAAKKGASTPEAAASQRATQPAAPAAPEEDLSALSEADRARYRGIDQAWEEKRWQDVNDTIFALAKAYPDSFPVQQKACRVGMQLGLSYRALKPVCDRMTALSMTQPASTAR
jgi:hypothetical protein